MVEVEVPPIVASFSRWSWPAWLVAIATTSTHHSYLICCRDDSAHGLSCICDWHLSNKILQYSASSMTTRAAWSLGMARPTRLNEATHTSRITSELRWEYCARRQWCSALLVFLRRHTLCCCSVLGGTVSTVNSSVERCCVLGLPRWGGQRADDLASGCQSWMWQPMYLRLHRRWLREILPLDNEVSRGRFVVGD
jgi:hypothetical protein